MPDEPIYVTQPHLPPLEEFIPYLEQIWESKILTNNGPFHQQLEQALCDYLGVEHLSLFTNGTIALVTALQALRIAGEVITTPYLYHLLRTIFRLFVPSLVVHLWFHFSPYA